MTTKERVHVLVDALADAQADRLLEVALTLTAAGVPASASLPAFVGSFRSGTSDTAERAEEFLRNELGGHAGS